MKDYLKFLRDVDKAPNNAAVVCQRYYIDRALVKELGLMAMPYT